MNPLSEDKRQHIKNLVELIEKVFKYKALDKAHLKDEVEKHFSYICQGKDDLNPYERRDAGIDDETWEKSIDLCREALGLKVVKNEKLF